MMWMRFARLAAAGGSAALLPTVACRPVPESGPRLGEAVAGAASPTATLFPVAPPPFSEDIFPCSECHDPNDKVNRTPHKLEFHDEVVLHHDETNRWCLDCHDAA